MAIIVKSRDSLLTTSSGYTNYRGILNLVIILLVLSNARAALENIIKYGILVDPFSWFSFFNQASKHGPAIMIVLNLAIHILISYLIELIISKSLEIQRNQWPLGKQIQSSLPIFLNLLACLSIPPMIVYTHDTHPISTSASLMLVSIVFLKLVSYHMFNYWCRDIKLHSTNEKLSKTTKSFLRSYTPPEVDFEPLDDRSSTATAADASFKPDRKQPPPNKGAEEDKENRQRQVGKSDDQQVGSTTGRGGEKTTSSPRRLSSGSGGKAPELILQVSMQTLSKYPQNVNLKNMISFMLFPTLCYELEYARIRRIRKRFLIKRIVELIILSQLDLALVQQWIIPTVSNSVLPFRQMQFSHMLERLLKLAIPNHVIWLIWFYLFFHSLLNIAAELTRFADREFYRDWWNSESVYYFWSNWNIPVHKWCARHLYVPLIALGLSKCQASTTVFFVSAFFHEYLVSVPLKMFRMWAFTGMLIQLPWARFVSSYFNNNFANVAVWVSLIIGQPLCILMYYHDYYVINSNENKL